MITPQSLWRGVMGMFGKTPAAGAKGFGGGDVMYPSLPMPIDPYLALQSACVWACCRLLSEAVASLPGRVYQATPEGKDLALKHPYQKLLAKQPNPLMTSLQWIQTTVLHLCLYGNAFTVPEMVDGEAVALWPVLPIHVRLQRRANSPVWNYVYTDMVTGQMTTFDPLARQLLHFRIFSLDGVMGLSPIQYQAATIAMDGASAQYALALYQNGGRPSGVLSYPNSLKAEQVSNIRSVWKSLHSGPTNAGNVAVLENGAKYEALTIPPEQLQYIAQQHFSTEQIARIFGVPPHLVGAMDKPTYASVEQQSLEFLTYTLTPIVAAIEQTISAVLLDDPYFYRMKLQAFERSDIRSRYASYATGRQWGFLSVNDIRDLEDMNRVENGDVYLQPLNMVPAGSDTLSATTDPGTDPATQPQEGVTQ